VDTTNSYFSSAKRIPRAFGAGRFIVTARTKDGRTLQVKVIARFTIKKGKIAVCDELTHVMNGTEKDKD
jgi:hypothetical protein